MIAVSGLLGIVVATILSIVLARRSNSRGQRRSAATASGSEVVRSFYDPSGLGDWATSAPLLSRQSRADPGRSHAAEWPIDRVLPRYMTGTLALAVVVALGLWLAGLALTPSVPRFLSTREWHFQPLYIAAHIVAVRLFVRAYARGFLRGVSHLAIPPERTTTLVRRILGVPGVLAAFAIAVPFAALDFAYLFSDRYDRLGGTDMVLAVDYLMWGIWSVEWFLNAFIWVVLVGFLIKNCWVIRTYDFRSPIEIVLHDRHYRPFLEMSAQGSSIVLAFTAVTVFYIWYTGGEITDYVGLAVTAVLLVAGFVPPWALLKSKVRNAVQSETLTMRRVMLRNLELAETESHAAAVHNSDRSTMKSLEHRLDAAVSLLRITYLENRNQALGATEARAITVRMLAPAVSIGWQLAKSQGALLADIQAYLLRWF